MIVREGRGGVGYAIGLRAGLLRLDWVGTTTVAPVTNTGDASRVAGFAKVVGMERSRIIEEPRSDPRVGAGGRTG